MKAAKRILILSYFFSSFNFCPQIFPDDIGNAEILIQNFSNGSITVKIYPAGSVFSGNYIYDGHSYEYSLSRSRRTGVIPESCQIDLQKEDRAKRNILELRNMSKEQKEKRRLEEITMTAIDVRNEINRSEIVNTHLEYKLNQNFPNPFNPSTNISYYLPVSSFVTLKVYDITGKEIVTLVNEYKQTGSYQVTFNGINLSSGIYYFRISAGGFSQVRKMMLIK